MKKEFEEILEKINIWSYLGERTVANGARLIGYIPDSGSEAYLHIIYAPLPEEKIEQIEKDIQMKLPEVYKEFLRCSNGINIFFRAFALYGLRKDFTRAGDEARQPFDIRTPNTFERPKDADRNILIIGGYSKDGSKILLDVNDGKIFRCERYHAKKILNEWSDIWTMLDEEFNRLSKLFNEKGILIDKDSSTTL